MGEGNKTKDKTILSAQEEQRQAAEKDYLTGLPNRRGLYTYYDSLPKGSIVHAMYLDVDNFKSVNDTYGHSMGDELLIAIARLIEENTKAFPSRIGGDEYVVVFDGANSEEALGEMARSMLQGMQEMDFRKDILSLISLSIGIVVDQTTDQTLDDVLAKCDAAMYEAKTGGKNRYIVYRADDKDLKIRQTMELEMEDAVAQHEFQVYFQPKINMVTSQVYGAEALSRWKHHTGELRYPELYIPLFEKNGFIARLDMYIFEEVCRIKSTWKGKKYEHLPISVNMSRLHLYNRSFPEQLAALAKQYEIPVAELSIEITENVFIRDTAELTRMVDLLEAKGFHVAIDDFGSGFSALSLFKDIPVDTVKIDKNFLQDSTGNNRGRKVLRNIIAMCRDLKIDVIAEGVENKEQVEFLTSCGCQIAQGFYYSEPLSLEHFCQYADENMDQVIDAFVFRLNGSLLSEDGSQEAAFVGKGFHYEQGIFRDSQSMYFPGGPLETNFVEVPPKVIVNDSFSISLWIRPRTNHLWTVAIYVKFETGFCAIVPEAWEGHSDFRIRDSREIDGWYDLSAAMLPTDRWSHFMITYNAKTEMAVAFINGEVVSRLEAPTNRYVKRIMLGGDVFQPSFHGNLCELVIFNEAKDYDQVREFHHAYVDSPDFVGFESGSSQG